MDDKEENNGVIKLAQQTLQANTEHIDALKTYTQRLEAELETLDKLLDAADAIDESDLDVGCSVTIPGSVRATAPIPAKELLFSESPFYEDALKHSRYQSLSEVHPMKAKELEALAEAVRSEGYRKHVLDIQQRGFPAFPNLDAQTTRVPAPDAEGIDWSRIAEEVSAISVTTRTARECEIRWLGEQHPEFNHEPWSKEEVLKAKFLAAEFGDSRPDWVSVAKRLGTRRTPLDCMRHATSRKVHKWTTDSDERLLRAIRMYGHNNWHLVARYVSEDATPSQCSNRFEKTLDQSVKRTAWSQDEDDRLSAAVIAYGSSWVDVAANIHGRHNDQCRDRWTEQVNPSINKNPWSKEEDQILLNYAREYEHVSWKDIAGRLCNGRTEAMCRNRYSVLQKGANCTVMSAANHEDEAHVAVSSGSASLSSSSFIFKSAFPNAYSSTPPVPPPNDTENCHPSKIVFLEPVVSSSGQSQEYHRPQPPTRFKTTIVGDIQPSSTTTMPPSKKRKTKLRITKPKKSAKEAEQITTSSRYTDSGDTL